MASSTTSAHPEVDLSSLKGMSCIITGGCSGMGLANALAFASHGAFVTIADISPPPESTPLPPNITYIATDTTSYSSLVAAFKQAVTFSPNKTLDFAALYAGVTGTPGSLVDQAKAAATGTSGPSLDNDPPKPPHRALDINLLGVYDSTYLALYYMQIPGTAASIATNSRSAPTKSILLISSIAGYGEMPTATDYPASKYGVRGIFRSIRHAAPPLGVRINLLAPYWINTPLVQNVLTELHSLGIKEGQGLTFASMTHVLDCAGRCAVDVGVSAKSFAIMPEGCVDLREDEEGAYGGKVLGDLLRRRREVGDLIQ